MPIEWAPSPIGGGDPFCRVMDYDNDTLPLEDRAM
jgi:hypothetical protein